MRPATLRARIAAAAAVAIVAAVAALAIAVPALLASRLHAALDRSLRARAADVARLAAGAPDVLLQPGALEGRLGGGTLYVQVVDARGRIVARSSGLGARVLPMRGAATAALRDRRAGFGDDRLGADPIRVFAAPLGELGRGPAAGGGVIVAGTTADITGTLASTRGLVLACAAAAAALAAALAMALTRRALRPLARLSSGARAIETSGDPAARLPDPPADDEVGELARTLNAMLASLARAREAERRFVADASHELRTPLTALRGNAAYVARHGPDAAALADLEADAERLGTLLDDLLALAREDAAAPVGGAAWAARDGLGAPVDLADVAREAAGADARVVEAGAAPVLALGDRAALGRAVGNLVANARRHGRGAVTVTVSAAGGRARITVEDEGPGVPPEEAERVFERFRRGGTARGEGSGLGLSIVRAVAERHGGRVAVDGARFTIDLPAFKDLSRTAGRTT